MTPRLVLVGVVTSGVLVAATVSAPRLVSPQQTPPTVQTPSTAEFVHELRGRHLLIPIEGVRASALRDSFREARDQTRTHDAIDILAPRNTPVRAVEAGTIAKLFLSKPGGNTIYQFDPTESYAYYYAHLERYAPELHEHQRVAAGQVIGYVGTSGNAPPNTPHLHFAIFKLTPDKHWWQGTPIDPFDVFR